MPIPIESVGVGAISGGAVVAFLMKIVPIVMKKMNGNSKNNNSDKPGKADVCIKRGNKVTEHDTTIKQLCTNMEKYEKTAETARKENNKAHEKIFDKLDALK